MEESMLFVEVSSQRCVDTIRIT